MYQLTDGGGTGTYTEAELRARLLGPSAAIGCRYEILDENLEPIGDGDRGHLSTVEAATRDIDGGRLIPGALKLSMLPDPLLPIATTIPFSRYIRPWWQIRMADGGIAEWPRGVYVWTQPAETSLGRGVTRWDVVLGDLSHLMSITGPDLDGYLVPTMANATAAIAALYTRALARIVDVSGIVQSEATVPGALFWSIVDGSSKAATGGPVGAGAGMLSGAPATSWQTILKTLHAGIGYQPPRFGWLGAPVARPFPLNLFAQPASFTFTADADSILEPKITSKPRLDMFANRVVAVAANASPNAFQGFVVADANEYLPGHPWSQAECHRYVSATIPNAASGDARTLLAAAVGELYVRMAAVSEASIETQMWPTIEPWDVLGVELDGYSIPQRFLASAYTEDLITGQMRFRLPKIVGALEPAESAVTSSTPPAGGDFVLVDAGGDFVLVDAGGDRVLVS